MSPGSTRGRSPATRASGTTWLFMPAASTRRGSATSAQHPSRAGSTAVGSRAGSSAHSRARQGHPAGKQGLGRGFVAARNLGSVTLRFAPYIELLRRNPAFRRLYAAQLISFAGDWFATVALLGLALDLSGSAAIASLVI